MGKFNPENFVVEKVLKITFYGGECFCGFKQDRENAVCVCPKCGKHLITTWNEVEAIDFNNKSH